MLQLRSHKGITLLELLLAIFLTSITLGLVAQILTLMIRSSQSSILQSRANTTGVLLVETLESKMREFSPTTLSLCEGEPNCIILEQHFNFLLTDTGVIVDYVDPPHTLKIEIIENQIVITENDESPYTLELSGFTLTENTKIKTLGVVEPITSLQKVSIIIEIEFFADGISDKTYRFTAAYLFTIDIRIP
jgi:hypothetical protein